MSSDRNAIAIRMNPHSLSMRIDGQVCLSCSVFLNFLQEIPLPAEGVATTPPTVNRP